jgi:hypothetical protein
VLRLLKQIEEHEVLDLCFTWLLVDDFILLLRGIAYWFGLVWFGCGTVDWAVHSSSGYFLLYDL